MLTWTLTERFDKEYLFPLFKRCIPRTNRTMLCFPTAGKKGTKIWYALMRPFRNSRPRIEVNRFGWNVANGYIRTSKCSAANRENGMIAMLDHHHMAEYKYDYLLYADDDNYIRASYSICKSTSRCWTRTRSSSWPKVIGGSRLDCSKLMAMLHPIDAQEIKLSGIFGVKPSFIPRMHSRELRKDSA